MADDQLEAIVAEVLSVEHAVTDATGADTEHAWDSLAQLEILISVEQEFGVQFSAEEMATATSVGKIRQLIASRTSVR
jgi:acyl carrier protein